MPAKKKQPRKLRTKVKAASEQEAPSGKVLNVETVVNFLKKKYEDEGVASTLGIGGLSQVREVLPTGLEVLDRYVIGIGGLPYGRIVEIRGDEDTGKSSLVNQILAAAQRDGAVASLGDSERKVYPEWVEKFGVDREQVLLLPAETIESYLEHLRDTIERFAKRQKFVFCLDSVATLQPLKALEEDLNDKEIPGVMAAAWSRGLRSLAKLISKHDVLLVLVNQLRSKIGVMYGPTETSAGGRAIPYYSTIRLQVNHGKVQKEGDAHVGKWANVRAIKNHVAPQMRTAEIYLDFGKGWDNDRSLMRFAKNQGAVGGKCRSLQEARKNLDWGYVEGAEDVLVDVVGKEEEKK